MSIIKEIREISSAKIAAKQKLAKEHYPKIIERIKAQAEMGKTSAEFEEYVIDEYTRKLLKADGFVVFASTKQDKRDYLMQRQTISIWVVQW